MALRTCFFMREPFIWSQTPGSREELATALTCDTALKNKKKVLVTKKCSNNFRQLDYFQCLVRNAAGDRLVCLHISDLGSAQ